MTQPRRHAAALGGFALFAAALTAIGAAGGGQDIGDSRGDAPFRLLPTGQQADPTFPTIASTPVPEGGTAPASNGAGIWSTPAEFAPPE